MTIFLPMPGNEALAEALASLKGGVLGRIETRRFPDGESYVRILSELEGRPACIVCTLAQPDEKLLPLLFVAATARRLGSPRISLVAPYLAYMRQDAVFRPGEALASRDFAGLLSSAFDALITVDPHLHRYRALSDVYACATRVVRAAPSMGRWIAEHVDRPLIVGPDSESEQWAAEIAATAGAPHILLAKERLGDDQVRLRLPELSAWREFQPVLVDDIISSGATIASAAEALEEGGLRRPICVVVHSLIDQAGRERLLRRLGGLVSTDTVPGPDSRIETAALIAEAL